MLTKDREKMITLYIEGNKITDIAKVVDVSRQTIYSWLNEEDVKAEMDGRRRDIANHGNQLILKDADTYISNIKALANDKSDKRVCLAANQYLLNRIYGNPTVAIENANDEDNNGSVDTFELEAELKRFKIKGKGNV